MKTKINETNRASLRSILAFCHIPKVAGVTLQELLTYQFGKAHCDTSDWRMPAPNSGKLAWRVRGEMRIHGKCLSVGGHAVRPWIGLEETGLPLRWYAMLREPVERLISHYLFYYETTANTTKKSFEDWLQNYAPLNMQTKFLCGEQDAEKAKSIILEHLVSVGLQDHFTESVEHLGVKEGWSYIALPDGKRNTSDRRNRDRAAAKRREHVRQEAERLSSQIEDANSEDRELYRWVKEELWPEQHVELEDAKKRGLVEIGPPRPSDLHRRKRHLRFRHWIFKPLIAARFGPIVAAKRKWNWYRFRVQS